MATPLAERHCEVCRPGTPTLPRDAIDRLLAQVRGWTVADVAGHLELTRTYRFKGFLPGVDLVNQIAPIAEAEDHHPDLHLSYGSLKVDLWTHAAGGLTDNDFILAAKIDRIGPN
ncbi:MAG TPA: 4a-hydroxytetrahydrobiopterin dehydratase [Candidatus Limnocylindrales bacterium]|nr:4a-hydroxytetrahydrobiopterin dehydratase [Candidatus Limnocylindrales bacterium]